MAFHKQVKLDRIFLGIITISTLIQAQVIEENDQYAHADHFSQSSNYFHLQSRDIRLLRVKRETNDTAITTSPSTEIAHSDASSTQAGTAPPTTAPPTTGAPSTGAPTSEGSPKPTGGLPTTLPPDFKEAPDDHKYYVSNVGASVEDSLWVDIDKMESGTVIRHGVLSESHRTAATVKLSFDFVFYGHYVKQVTIATGGFLYMSDFLHQWLTATQYIAPLMANFDSSIGGADSNIHYVDNGTAFIVQWTNVHLQDQEFGPYTFQTVLLKGGVVIFNYKSVPRPVDAISISKHPVKIGCSDAFYIDRPIQGRPNVHRRTIYEYHRVEIKKYYIRNGTTVYIKPVNTCVQMTNCSACLSDLVTRFNCSWCQKEGRCSDGMDRHRQRWLSSGCDQSSVYNSSREMCEVYARQSRTAGAAVGAVIVILILIVLISAIVGWFYYAYKNPTTRSGMWLMEHRPSQLKMKMKFWKKEGSSGDKYSVSVEPSGNESTA